MLPQNNALTTLRHRGFRMLWFGQLWSWLGMMMSQIVLSWQVWQMTGSAFDLAMVALARAVPFLVLSFVGGTVADTLDRRRVLIISQAALALITVALAYMTATETISMPAIYILALLLGGLNAFEAPARQAMVPNLIPREELPRALTMVAALRQSATIIGPAVGGVMIAQVGIWPTHAASAAAYVVSIGFIILLGRVPQAAVERNGDRWRQMLGGLTLARRDRIILTVFLLDFSVIFFAGARSIMPVFATDVLNVGPEGLGLLTAAPAAGALVSAAILTTMGDFGANLRVAVISWVLFGLFTIFFGISSIFWLSLVFLFIMGALDVVGEIVRNTIVQLRTPDELRGRILGLQMVFTNGGPRLADVKAGLLADAIGPMAAVAIGGALAIVATLALVAPRSVRQLAGGQLAAPPEPPQP